MGEGTEMSSSPKLLVKRPRQYPPTEIYTLEQARYSLFGYGSLVIVEGQLIKSYEELVQFANQHKDKEFLEVLVSPLAGGG
jgi:hypothetical protein